MLVHMQLSYMHRKHDMSSYSLGNTYEIEEESSSQDENLPGNSGLEASGAQISKGWAGTIATK